MKWLGRIGAWFAAEYFNDYRQSRDRIFDTIIKNSLHLNTVILTVSVASLTAVAALNDKIIVNYSLLLIIVVGFFIFTILFSTVNFFLSDLVMRDLQRDLNKDILLPLKISKGEYKIRFRMTQKALSSVVMFSFCVGLIMLLALLILYILRAA